MAVIEFVIVLIIAYSLAPIIITGIWLFKAKKLGYSWKETWKIEMYNMDIHYAKRGLYMNGYSISDINEELPKEIVYIKK